MHFDLETAGDCDFKMCDCDFRYDRYVYYIFQMRICFSGTWILQFINHDKSNLSNHLKKKSWGVFVGNSRLSTQQKHQIDANDYNFQAVAIWPFCLKTPQATWCY